MAHVHRRPGTRNNPSSTQLEVEFSGLQLGEDKAAQDDQELTQDQFFVPENDNYTPQIDNASSMLPDDDDDYVLKEHMQSQQQAHLHDQEQFKKSLEQEFETDFNALEDKFMHDNNNDSTQATSVNHYTQGALGAASVLVGGFDGRPCPSAVRCQHYDEMDEELERQCIGFKNCTLGVVPTADNLVPRNAAVNYSKSDPPIPPSIDPNDDGTLTFEIASNLCKDGNTGLSEEERSFVANKK